MQETFFPLGFPLVVSTNSAAVLAAAREEWSAWTQSFDEEPVILTFRVSGERVTLPDASSFHALGDQFAFVADAQHLGICDIRTRTGSGWISAGAAEDSQYFRYHFLEGMALEMLAALHLTPFHAASIARNGSGVLLCGHSQAGKSSLSYACARRGWSFMSDDASYLLRGSAVDRIVLGHSHRVRLRPDAPALFPELAATPPERRGNGKLSLLASTGHIPTVRRAPVDRIVLLRRGEKNQLTSVHPQAARDYCEPIFYWWNARVSAAQQAAFDALLSGSETLALEYRDLEAAAELLER